MFLLVRWGKAGRVSSGWRSKWGLPWGLLCETSCWSKLCMVPCHSCHIYGIWRSREVRKVLKVVSVTFRLVCFMSKGEHLRNKEKYFLFHFKNFFHSWDNLKVKICFSDIQMSLRHQMPKQKTQNTFYWMTWGVNTVW